MNKKTFEDLEINQFVDVTINSFPFSKTNRWKVVSKTYYDNNIIKFQCVDEKLCKASFTVKANETEFYDEESIYDSTKISIVN